MENFIFCAVMFFYVFFCNVIKVNNFLYCFISLLHLISSFSLTRSLLVPYAYVSIETIDCILLSSFELKTILLISSAKTLWLSLLNYFCVCNINSLFFMNSLWLFLSLTMLILFLTRWFILFSSLVASKRFYNFPI